MKDDSFNQQHTIQFSQGVPLVLIALLAADGIVYFETHFFYINPAMFKARENSLPLTYFTFKTF